MAKQYKRTFDNMEQFDKAMTKHYGADYAQFIVESTPEGATILRTFKYYKTEVESLDNLIGFVVIGGINNCSAPAMVEATIYYGV